MRHQKLGPHRAFLCRLRSLEIAVDRNRRGDIGAVARELQNIAATEAEADGGPGGYRSGCAWCLRRS
jgi:hypothetical protein